MLRAAIACLAIATSILGMTDSHAQGSTWPLHFDGYGPVRLGMTVEQAEQVLRTQLVIDDYLDDASCRFFTPKGPAAQPTIAFMTDHGRIVRIDVFPGSGPQPATDRGAKIGDTEARIFELYQGRVKSGPHHYTGPQGHYLRVFDDSGRVRMIFETNGKTVESYRVGREPAVEYVEGCL